jgi:dTDP-glucose pyrophosphorylase
LSQGREVLKLLIRWLNSYKKAKNEVNKMNPKINIIVEGAEENTVKSALKDIPQISLKKTSEGRGLTQGVAKALTLVAEFIGSSAKVTDALVEQATSQLAGATVKVQYGSMIIEVTNANRSQVAGLLDKAVQAAREADNL